jgi:hypothetical protein
MTFQRFRWIAVVASLLFAAAMGDLQAQTGIGQSFSFAPQPVAYGAAPGYAVAPAAVPSGAGFSFVSPASYAGGDGMYSQGPMVMDGSGSCDCDECAGTGSGLRRGHRLGQGIRSILALLAPYGEGRLLCPALVRHPRGSRVSESGQWWAICEFSRDTSGISRITSNDLGLSDEPGMRITGAYQTGPGSNLEFTYLGLFDYSTTARATGNEDLLSAFSDFTDLAPPNGLEQFDLANLHQVTHSHNFDSLELNYRRRWLGPTCAIQGSWLVGIRYARVQEKLRWLSVAERDSNGDGIAGYRWRRILQPGRNNYMTGAQLGGDTWFCLLPGLNFGIDGKLGIYGNNVSQRTSIYSIDFEDEFIGILPEEKVSNDKVTFIGELNLLVTYRLNHKFTLRGGYNMVFIDGVATAMNNFNPDIPQLTTRTPFLSDGASLFYDGFSIGAEYMW